MTQNFLLSEIKRAKKLGENIKKINFAPDQNKVCVIKLAMKFNDACFYFNHQGRDLKVIKEIS